MTDKPNYRCRKCKTIVPRGWRMQSCECGSVTVDFSVDDGLHGVRILWPGGKLEDWVEDPDQGESHGKVTPR
jgi:hypothetical protein